MPVTDPTLFKTDTINGVEVEFLVTSTGNFHARLKGDDEYIGSGLHNTFESCLEAAKRAVKKASANISIPFIHVDNGSRFGGRPAGPPKFRTAVAKKLHAGNDDILGDYTDAEGGKLRLGWNAMALRADTPDSELARLTEIYDEIKKLEAERQQILDRRSFDLKGEVTVALRAAGGNV